MFKIAITGKANSGKNTVAKLLLKGIYDSFRTSDPVNGIVSNQFIAFADPIKKMVMNAFPTVPRKWLYGPSKFRAMVIPGAFKDGVPLTVRQALCDLGNDFGRKYQQSIWLNNFDNTFNKAAKKNRDIIIVTDVRFRNEFDHLKNKDFFQIRLLRDSHLKSNDESETNQDTIKMEEYDCVIHNNKTLKDLKQEVSNIIPLIASK